MGCANQAGEDNRNVGRMAILLAGLPTAVSESTINRLCSSDFDAVGSAVPAIWSGDAMEALGLKRAIATMCVGVGQDIAASVEQV